jgi:hypothetical protein
MGKQVLIPADQAERVVRFLRAVDGKGVSAVAGRDYEGQRISEAEMRFRLGAPDTWDADHAEVRRARSAKPRVLTVDPDDLAQLQFMPSYVTHELLNCARKAVLAPTSVFKGLRRGDGSPPEVDDGWAFCGKPRHAFRNDGSACPAAPGMVYLVYADVSNHVFDWDWVREHPQDHGFPLDWNLRFGNPHPMDTDLVLDLPRNLAPGSLDQARAGYSKRGDCIFCYITGQESFAERVNCDLTVFRHLKTNECTGFKIKNVRRILQIDRSIVMQDAPDISVSVDSVLLASLKRHPNQKVDVYQVLIKALYRRAGEPPMVKVPAQIAQAASA